MTANTAEKIPPMPAFCQGIQHFGDAWPDFDRFGDTAVIATGQSAIQDAADEKAAYQTLLGADALRYLTLQVTGSKGSGHPGGFASSAEAHAALMMLGHTNIVTEVGHHAPGFYSSMFLDSSLEEMGIRTMDDMMQRFREKHGLLGHLSGAIPGLLSPAGPLGQGQHFAMAGAYLHRDKLFPCTIGDGGLGEPYILSAIRMMESGFASREDIDTGMIEGCSHPMGPLSLTDLIGLDTCLAIMNVLHDGLADTKYRPCPLLTKYVEAGWLGRKTKRGFYDYRGEVPVPTR